ncbi:modular serine protease-like [Cydia amplana]|uniref:modular serine protease-like n=1 Tax=Cydia amplana TaxID=1869771 RepID=UPI002FE623FC
MADQNGGRMSETEMNTDASFAGGFLNLSSSALSPGLRNTRGSALKPAGGGRSTATTRSLHKMASRTCQLPPYPRIGSYSIVAIELRADLADFTLLYSCPSGYSLNGQHPRCVGGRWTSDDFPSCKLDSKCAMPSHPSVTYNCMESPICPNFVSSGQRVLPKCKAGFVQDALRAMHCIDGSWDYIATCRIECGTLPPQGMRLRRSVSGAREVPWHASVYDKTVTPYRQLCGGTLVSATVVISAAHCFWRDSTLVKPTSYAVAVKVYRPWWDDHGDGQKTDISSIKVSPYFRGAENHFQSDIALVTLKTAVTFTYHVRPACVDLSVTFDEEQLRPGNIGKTRNPLDGV